MTMRTITHITPRIIIICSQRIKKKALKIKFSQNTPYKGHVAQTSFHLPSLCCYSCSLIMNFPVRLTSISSSLPFFWHGRLHVTLWSCDDADIISWISTPKQPMRVILLYQKKECFGRNRSHRTFSYKRICYSGKRVCSSSPWHSSTSIYSSVLQRWSRTERLQPAGRQPCRPVLTASDHAPEPYPHLRAWYPPPGERHTGSNVVQSAIQTERPVWVRVRRDGAELWPKFVFGQMTP